MGGARGVYRPRSEDHQTVALFQPFAALPARVWFPALSQALAFDPLVPDEVRIAYLHEETVPPHRTRFHGRDFVIADIVLHWRKGDTDGIMAFEVKRQTGPGPTEQDFEKARTYVEFASMQTVARRDPVFLVSDHHVRKVRGQWPHVACWSEVLAAQLAAAETVARDHPTLRAMPGLIKDLFSAYGIGRAPALSPPDPSVLFAAASAEGAPPSLAALAAGLAWTAHWRRGETEAPLPEALDWLRKEPTEDQLRSARWQKRPDRRVNRWSPDWAPAQERALRI